MGDYRRGKYDSYDTPRYSREGSYRRSDHFEEARQGDRYQRPPVSPPRDRHRERDRNPRYYDDDRGSSSERRAVDEKERGCDDSRPRRNSPRRHLETMTETGGKDHFQDMSNAPVVPEYGKFESYPSREGRADHHRPQEDQWDPGKPNAQIIFRGIDKSMTEADVSDFFTPRAITDSIVATILLQSGRSS